MKQILNFHSFTRFAYADYDDHSTAQKAIDSLSGQEGLFLDFAKERTSFGGGRGGGGRGEEFYMLFGMGRVVATLIIIIITGSYIALF